jgi:hypothetical protein
MKKLILNEKLRIDTSLAVLPYSTDECTTVCTGYRVDNIP